jgi:hypothetical protein
MAKRGRDVPAEVRGAPSPKIVALAGVTSASADVDFVHALVARTRREQGLPERVEDSVALRRVADVLAHTARTSADQRPA